MKRRPAEVTGPSEEAVLTAVRVTQNQTTGRGVRAALVAEKLGLRSGAAVGPRLRMLAAEGLLRRGEDHLRRMVYRVDERAVVAKQARTPRIASYVAGAPLAPDDARRLGAALQAILRVPEQRERLRELIDAEDDDD